MSDKKVQSTDLAKRRMLKKIGLGMGAAFAVPLLASFSKDGLLISAAQAGHIDKGEGHGGKKKGGKK